MAYVIPRAEITQQFTATPVFTSSPLPALILGPNYKLSRYAVASEKANTKLQHPDDAALLNLYQPDSDEEYAYPSGDTNVDTNYVKLFLENAEVKVFPNTALGSPSATVTKVSGYTNRIISGVVNLKTANGTTRAAALGGRDVQVGDVVVVTDATSEDVLKTKVKSLIATVTAASLSAVTEDAANTGDVDVMTVAGTYTGTENLTYTVTIERGGAFYTGSNGTTCARAKITSNGVDSSATVNVASSTPFPVGTFGVTAQFTDDGVDNLLTAGDKFYVTATAAAPGVVRTIELEDNLTTDQQDGGAVLTMAIYLVKNTVAEIPRIRSLENDTVNWIAENASFTTKSGITLTDSLIVDGSDVPLPLPVGSGKLFVQHRSLVTTLSTAIGSVTSAGQVTSKLGPVHPDNPLAQGVYDAVVNAASTVVYFGAIPTDDLAGYNNVLELARKDNKYYSLVPLTFDAAVQNAVIGHVDAMSSAAEAKWRIAWVAKPFTTTALVYNLKSDLSHWTGTVADNGGESGTQYTLVTIAGASLVTDGVRPGDTLLINFRLDANGDTIFDEYEIEAVRSQTQLLLLDGLEAAISSAVKVQIRRSYTTAEQVASYAAIAGEFNNRRVRCVFPDTFFAGSQLKDGYYLAASLAGLRSGVVPHQGLTNIQVLGPTELPRVVNDLTEDQLNTLAEAGVWIVTQAALGATPYTRHQLTTDETGLNFAEDSITTNVDSISYALQAKIAPFVGLYNVNPGTVLQVRAAVDAELAYRATNTWTARSGNQLNGYVIDKVEQNASFKDRIDVQVTLQVPAPLNTVKLNLTV